MAQIIVCCIRRLNPHSGPVIPDASLLENERRESAALGLMVYSLSSTQMEASFPEYQRRVVKSRTPRAASLQLQYSPRPRKGQSRIRAVATGSRTRGDGSVRNCARRCCGLAWHFRVNAMLVVDVDRRHFEASGGALVHAKLDRDELPQSIVG